MQEQQPLSDIPVRAGHERTDVSPRNVALAVCAMGIFLIVSLALIVGLFRWFEADFKRSDVAGNLLQGDQVPPKPRLQFDPGSELAKLRADEDQRLSSYGWVDEKERILRIPIQAAIKILAQRGFPEPVGPVELPPREEHKP